MSRQRNYCCSGRGNCTQNFVADITTGIIHLGVLMKETKLFTIIVISFFVTNCSYLRPLNSEEMLKLATAEKGISQSDALSTANLYFSAAKHTVTFRSDYVFAEPNQSFCFEKDKMFFTGYKLGEYIRAVPGTYLEEHKKDYFLQTFGYKDIYAVRFIPGGVKFGCWVSIDLTIPDQDYTITVSADLFSSYLNKDENIGHVYDLVAALKYLAPKAEIRIPTNVSY
jgi:hypothetical protein